MEIKKIVFERLKKITSKSFNENSNIYSIGIDSLDLIEMVTEVEKKFKITIPDEELIGIKTVNDIIKVLQKFYLKT